MKIVRSRRDFLTRASLAATAGILGGRGSFADEAPPEITTICLGYWPGYACITPQTIAEEMLLAEGFTDVRFLPPSHINTERYEYALQTLTELSYDKWREFDPEDSLRFFALRLHEVGLVESAPNRIIAEGTDWRFLNELKRELRT